MMASPNQTQSPINAGQPRAPPIYMPPRSAEEIAREQKRVNLLLEINNLLVQHISQLQGDGMGGLTTPQQQPPADPANMPKMASQEYMQCLRCMQANMTWLAASAQGTAGNSRTLSGPAFIDSPVDSPVFLQKYEELKKLFPNWRGMQSTRHAMQMSQQYAGQGQGPTQMSPQQQQQHPNQHMPQQPMQQQHMPQQSVPQQSMMNPMHQNLQSSPGSSSNPQS